MPNWAETVGILRLLEVWSTSWPWLPVGKRTIAPHGVGDLVFAPGKPLTLDLNHPGNRLRSAVTAPKAMTGRDIGHLPVGKLPGDLVDLLEPKTRRVRGSLLVLGH